MLRFYIPLSSLHPSQQWLVQAGLAGQPLPKEPSRRLNAFSLLSVSSKQVQVPVSEAVLKLASSVAHRSVLAVQTISHTL